MSKRDCCSYCGVDGVRGKELDIPPGSHLEEPPFMCAVCYGLGMSQYPKHAYEPVTRAFLSAAVRFMLESMGKSP